MCADSVAPAFTRLVCSTAFLQREGNQTLKLKVDVEILPVHYVQSRYSTETFARGLEGAAFGRTYLSTLAHVLLSPHPSSSAPSLLTFAEVLSTKR